MDLSTTLDIKAEFTTATKTATNTSADSNLGLCFAEETSSPHTVHGIAFKVVQFLDSSLDIDVESTSTMTIEDTATVSSFVI